MKRDNVGQRRILRVRYTRTCLFADGNAYDDVYVFTILMTSIFHIPTAGN